MSSVNDDFEDAQIRSDARTENVQSGFTPSLHMLLPALALTTVTAVWGLPSS